MKSKSLIVRFCLLSCAVFTGPVFALDVQPPKGLEVKSTKVKELAVAEFWIACSSACVLPKDAKRSGVYQDLVLSGRVEERSVHRVAGAGVVGPAVGEYRDLNAKHRRCHRGVEHVGVALIIGVRHQRDAAREQLRAARGDHDGRPVGFGEQDVVICAGSFSVFEFRL